MIQLLQVARCERLFLLVALFAAAIMSGCTNLHRPYPPRHPDPKLGTDSSGEANQTRTKPENVRGEARGLLPAEKAEDAIDNIEVYAMWYADQANRLRKVQDDLNDVSYGGAIVGLGAGIAKEIDWAIAGAGVSSATDVYEQRYHLAAQESNYRKASEAFYCMLIEVNHAKDKLDGLVEDESKWLSEAAIKKVNALTDSMVRKLDKALRGLQLASPDLNKAADSALEQARADIAAENARRKKENAQDEEDKAAKALEIAKDGKNLKILSAISYLKSDPSLANARIEKNVDESIKETAFFALQESGLSNLKNWFSNGLDRKEIAKPEAIASLKSLQLDVNPDLKSLIDNLIAFGEAAMRTNEEKAKQAEKEEDLLMKALETCSNVSF